MKNKRMTAAMLGIAMVMMTSLLLAQKDTMKELPPITPEKAQMMGYVEDYFMRTPSSIVMKKSLEWGDVTTASNGEKTIRYQFEARSETGKQAVFCINFTFDSSGKFVNKKNVEIDNKASIETQKTPVKIDVHGSMAANQAGWQLFMSGKTEQAKEKFLEAVELNPQNTASLNGLGRIAFNVEQDEDAAIKYWEQAIEADNKNASGAMFGLAELYKTRGDYKNALKYYKMCLKVEPNNKDVQQAIQATEKMLKK